MVEGSSIRVTGGSQGLRDRRGHRGRGHAGVMGRQGVRGTRGRMPGGARGFRGHMQGSQAGILHDPIPSWFLLCIECCVTTDC
jgi:hypothetical protein